MLLDNPIWSALTTVQRPLARGDALAARFPLDIAPLGGMRDQSPAAYQAMESLATREPVVLFLEAPPAPPRGWTLSHPDVMYQMVYEGDKRLPPGKAGMRALGGDDVPAMLALTALTEPGPFRQRTIELGGYRGIFENGRLAAMAGQRTQMTGFTEISAVCTHPDFEGRGYGRLLVAAVTEGILERGNTPMLHVRRSNTRAVRLYASLGFEIRRELHLAILEYEPAPEKS